MMPINGHDILTHSRIKAFKECRYKHRIVYNLGVRKEPSEALRMGSCIHAAIDAYHRATSLTDAMGFIRNNYAKLEGATVDEAYTLALAVERERCLALVAGWISRWNNSDYEVVASELSFNVPIINPDTKWPSKTFRYAGKIDSIVRIIKRLGLGELKTTSDPIEGDSPFWQRLANDEQISFYMLAARTLGYELETVFYDVIKKPGMRPKLVKGIRQTPEQYGEGLAADIADRPTFYYQRREIPRLSSDLYDAQLQLWQVAIDIRNAERQNHIYKNSWACRSPYPCPLLRPCSEGHDFSSEHVPEGFYRTSTLHEELENIDANSTTDDKARSDIEREGYRVKVDSPKDLYSEIQSARPI